MKEFLASCASHRFTSAIFLFWSREGRGKVGGGGRGEGRGEREGGRGTLEHFLKTVFK